MGTARDIVDFAFPEVFDIIRLLQNQYMPS